VSAAAAPHLPRPAQIEAYGNGGFRFGGKNSKLSHRGSLLCFPDGIWAWPVAAFTDVSEVALAEVFARSGALDVFLLGVGIDPAPVAPALRDAFKAHRIAFDPMTTAAAVRTWNVLLAEGRRVGAGLIAV